MKTDIDQIRNQLLQASQSLSTGQLEQACARLSAASDLLDTCISEYQQQTSALDINEAVVHRPDGNRQLAKAALAMAG